MTDAMPPTPDLVLTFDTLGAPTQISGSVAGHHIYYRERHDRWRVEVDGITVAEGQDEVWHPSSDGTGGMGYHVKHIIDSIWHPYLSDRFNEREDAKEIF